MRETKHNTTSSFFPNTLMWIQAFFGVAVVIAAMIGAIFLVFRKQYEGKVYPNVFVDNVSFENLSPTEIEDYFLRKNAPLANITLTLTYGNDVATISGTELQAGYDATLSATQAYLVGRSPSFLSNIYTEAFQQKVNLSSFFRWNTQPIDDALTAIETAVNIPEENALFQFANGRVTAFKPSKDGQKLDRHMAEARITEAILTAAKQGINDVTIPMPIVVVHPEITTDKANSFGVKEIVGTGYSEFAGSIPGRIHNIALAASRINGILVKPGDTFSFNDTVGDITAATGYQSAYIIKDGHTVLGDGGGVCQVSTTLFRAALAAGLPIVERHAHDYRVHYYEEGGYKPGLDATVYAPTVDLKFKNDTPGYILIQTAINYTTPSLTFTLYGTRDGRTATIANIKAWDSTPPPPDLYQDDPTLPKGTVKQVDFSAWGLKTSFDYTVTRGSETLENTTFYSNFQPWQAVFLRGTL